MQDPIKPRTYEVVKTYIKNLKNSGKSKDFIIGYITGLYDHCIIHREAFDKLMMDISENFC